MESYTLPNGLTIKHSNAHETTHIYKDIFEKRLYLKHGIILPDHAVVFDAGANIGLFTLFILENCPTASLYAVEPAPKTFQALSANTSAYQRVKLYNCGLGSESKRMAFTYFSKLTCGSGYYQEADVERIKRLLRSLILADPEKSEFFADPVGEEFLDYYLDKELKAEIVSTQVHPLSFFIDEHRIEHIDLLKIDVEGSELEVLRGIRNGHWGLIRQMVVEVHDSRTSLPEVVELLQKHDYSIQTVSDILPNNIVGKTMVYAVSLSTGQKNIVE
jgi:FkbM family methyltransferase